MINRVPYISRFRLLCAKRLDFMFSCNTHSKGCKINNLVGETLKSVTQTWKSKGDNTMATKAQYPLNIAAPQAQTIKNGDFKPGHLYRCTWANPKAKKGENGQPRFTEGMTYMCIANATSTGETNGRPPTFLIDGNFRAVNVGADAKMKTTFVDA